jgi:hypothetical protein
MSQTVYVESKGVGFWAYDVVLAVFLKYLIDAACERQSHTFEAWLVDEVERWRVSAVISDFTLVLGSDWGQPQIETFTQLAEEVCHVLAQRDQIPAEEIKTWKMLGDLACSTRDLAFVRSPCVVRLARAAIRLVNGKLPEPPQGTWWFFGPDDGSVTIAKS